MSRTIDHRVVEMRFDNKQFESGAKQTMSTLSKLKEALKLQEAGKALEGIDKATKDIRLDGIASGVEALEKRFSTLGIVGMRVIENITDGLMSKLHKAVNFVTDSIVSGGIKRAMNIENAHFQLQALLKDETKVQAVMADAMESVDGTAYAYDEAAKAASQFAASGIQAGDEMLGALKGITGVAAMTNSSFENISTIFTTVAGNGRLMGDQLLQLSSRGLNAASTLADYFKEVRGQSDMTEGAIRDMVSKGQISFKDFSDAMTWAFGDSAKRANETFTGALSNMKSALARIGAGFISPLVEQNGEMVELFNALRIKINDVKSALVFDEQRSAIAGLTNESELLDETYGRMLRNGSISMETFVESMFKANNAEDVFGKKTEKVQNILTEFSETGKLTGEMLSDLNKFGTKSSDALRKYINGVQEGTIQASDSMKEQIKELGNGMTILNSDVKKWAEEGKISYELFTTAMGSYTRSTLDNAGAVESVLKGMFSEVKKEGHLTADALKDFSDNGMDATEAVLKYMTGVKDGSIRASYATRSAIESMTDGVNVNHKNLKKWLEEGAISYDIFQSAMENAYGTEKTLSKQFTDSFLDVIHSVVESINELDMTKPMEAFYYGFESIKNVVKGLYSVIKPVGEAFADVFFSFNGDDMISFAQAIETVTSKMRLSEAGSKDLHDAFKGIFDIVSLLGNGFIHLLSAILPIEKPINSLGGGLLGLAGNAGRSLSKFSELAKNSQTISKAYDFISSGVEKTSKWLDTFVKKADKFADSVKKFPSVQKVSDAISNFEGVAEKIEFRLTPFNDIMDLLFGTIKKSGPTTMAIVKELGNAFSFLLGSVSKALGTGDFNSIYDLFNVAVLSGIGIQLSKFIENINKTVKSAGGFFGSIKGIISGVTKTFNELQTTLKAETLKKIAVSLALIAGSIFVLSTIDSEKLTESLGAVSILLGELTGIFVLLNGLDKNKKSAIGSMGALTSMAISILILSSALKKISNIDSEKLLGALGAITALLVEMTGVAIALSKYGGKIKTGVVGIIAFSTAVYILSSAVRKLGNLDVDVLKKGLISVGALLAELSAFMVGAKFGQFKASQAVGIVILSASLLILQKAVGGFGSMNTEKLLTGIIAVAAVLTEIAAFSLVAGESKHILSTSISLVIMAKALEMLEKPMIVFGNMELSQIGKGLLVMGGALAEITLAMRLLPKNALTISVGLVATAEALTIISNVVLKMGGMSWEEIAKGMVALGGSMAILAVSMNTMKGTLGASAAMLVMSASLSIFVPVLKTLASMSWTEIAKGLIALAGGFATIGVSAALLSPVIPAMLGLAGAMALLGVAAAAVGAGVLALSVGLASLAASGVAGAAALVGVTKILIVGFLNAISDSAAALGRTVKTLVLTACDVLIECAPTIVKTVLVLVKEVLTALAENAPEIVSQLLKLIIGIVDALAADLPTVIQSVVNLFMQFFAGLIQALNGMDTNVLVEGIAGIGLISTLMLALAAMTSLAPSAMAGVLAMGVVIAELAVVLAAIGALAQIPGLKWLIDKGGDLLEGVGVAIGKFIGGIIGGVLGGMSSQLPQIGINLSAFMANLIPFINISKMLDKNALQNVGLLTGIFALLTAGEFVNGIANLFGLSLGDVAIELSDFMTKLLPFITLSKMLSEESMKACSYLANMILTLTATELVSGIGRMLGFGGSLTDFANELVAFAPAIKMFSIIVKDIKPEAVEGAAAAASIMAETASKLQGHGGLIQSIMGEKSLVDFANELVAFAPAIKMFSIIVKDIKPEAVEGAAAAASIMAEMAQKLPTQGGLAAKIFGERSLAEFGAELLAFGPSLVLFAAMVSSVKPEAVEGAAAAADIMSTLANNLPSSETLWNKIFGGGQVTLSEFGEELIKFGNSMVGFSNSVSGVNNEQLSGAISNFKSIADLVGNIQGLSTTDLVNFSNELGKIGTDSVTKFAQAFYDAKPKIVTAMNDMVKAALNAIQIKIPEFLTKGNSSAAQYIQGIKNKYGESTSTGRGLAENALKGIQSINKSFSSAGSNAGQGFVDGLKSKIDEAGKAGAALGKAAHEATKKALDEHSPSKKMGEVGDNAGLGFINKLMLYVSKAAQVGKQIGEATISGISLVMLDDVNDPVIRPAVDLSEVDSAFNDIKKRFNDAISTTTVSASSISSKFKTRAQENIEGNELKGNGERVVNIKYEQINNSPKPLSRTEIYRQTNNQLSKFKEALSRD